MSRTPKNSGESGARLSAVSLYPQHLNRRRAMLAVLVTLCAPTSAATQKSGAIPFQGNGFATILQTVPPPLTPVTRAKALIASATSANYTPTVAFQSSPTTQWTVCQSGCNYTNTQLQAALEAAKNATGPLEILLQEGFEYVADLVLGVKLDASSTNTVTIRTGVTSAGVIQPLTNYPSNGVRLCPTGFVQDEYSCATGGRIPYDAETKFAKIVPASKNAYGIMTADTATGPPVSYYNLRWLDFHPHAYGGNSLIGITNRTIPKDTGRLSQLPHHFNIDQIYLHVPGYALQKRGIEMNGGNISITNSHLEIANPARVEGQVIWANSLGGHLVENNFISGAAENFLAGGGRTLPAPVFTVQAGATTTTLPLDRIDDLQVTQQVAVEMLPVPLDDCTAAKPTICTTAVPHGYSTDWEILISGVTGGTSLNTTANAWTITVLDATSFTVVDSYPCDISLDASCVANKRPLVVSTGGTATLRASTEITGITGNTITVASEPLQLAPQAGALVRSSVVTDGMTFRYNYFTSPEAWITEKIVPTPTITSAVATTGGTLAADTYTYRLVGRRSVGNEITAISTASPGVNVVVGGADNAVAVTWPANPGATSGFHLYRITSGGVSKYFSVAAGATSFTDTGASGSSGTAPTSGTRYMKKNVWEFKQGKNILAEYNIFERSWPPDQSGPCVVWTGSQQTLGAASARLSDVVFRYNVVRRCGEFIQLTGRDSLGDESARARNFSVTHNLWYLWGGQYGSSRGVAPSATGGGRRQHPDRDPLNVLIEHNTFWTTLSLGTNTDVYSLLTGEDSGGLESPIDDHTLRNNLFHAGGSQGSLSSISPTAGRSGGRLGSPPFGTNKVFSHNAISGGGWACGAYEDDGVNIVCPTQADVAANGFVGGATTNPRDYKIAPGYTTLFGAASDGTMIGADLDLLYPTQTSGVAIAESGQYVSVSLTSTTATVAEGGGAYTVAVRLATAQALAEPVSVAYSTSSGTAVAGTDFIAVSGVLTFAAGSVDGAVETFGIPLIQDVEVEIGETLTANLTQPSNASVQDGIATITILPSDVVRPAGDFDGQGGSDLATFNPETGVWTIDGEAPDKFGNPGDLPVPADYNGDGTADVAVYRPGSGQWLFKDLEELNAQYGDPGDLPVPADYDDDGRADIAVYRPSTGMWFVRGQAHVQFGNGGDVPAPADFNGDGTADLAVYSPSTGVWRIRNQFTVSYGGPHKVPVPADYDGDRKADLAVYAPKFLTWSVQGRADVQVGLPGDRPVPRDYDGDGTTDVAVFRASTSTWVVAGQFTAQYGGPGDWPAPLSARGPLALPGDYDGNGAADVAVFRPSTAQWFVYGKAAVQHGSSGDEPVPADFDGDGIVDFAVFSPSTLVWSIQNQWQGTFGQVGDVPVPGDYNGDGTAEVAVYRPATGRWVIRGLREVQYGDPGDIPVPGDYNGDRVIDIAVYRPSSGTWFIRNQAVIQFGTTDDDPVIGDFNADGVTDIAVYRPSTGYWYRRNQTYVQWGDPGDMPTPTDYDGNLSYDIAVYRPSTGTWYVRNQFVRQYGSTGDVPVVKIGRQ